MNTSFEAFANELGKLNPLLCLVNDGQRVVKGIKLFDKSQGILQSDEIYLGRISSIAVDKQHYLDSEANIICVADRYVPKKLTRCKKLNLIVMDRNLDLSFLFNELQEIFNSRQRVTAMSMKLINQLAKGEGLQGIADVGLEIMGNPVIILNLSDNTVICSKVQLENFIWNELVNKKYLSLDLAIRYKASGIIEELNKEHKSKTPVLLIKKNKPKCIAVNVYFQQKPVAHVAIPDMIKGFSEIDMELATLLADAVSLEMQKKQPLQYNRGHVYEYFIRDLLDGAPINEKELWERLHLAGIKVKNINYILTIDLTGFDLSNNDLPLTINKLNIMIKGATSQIYKDAIVTIISRSPHERFGVEEQKHINSFLRRHNLTGGLSQEFSYFGDLQKYYFQALKAIELGRKMNKEAALYNYSDYILYHIVQVCSSQNDLKTFCHPLVFELEDFDERSNSSYSETLYVYLKNDRNVVAAAKELNIHRNTLNYRINKITEITKIDWNDGDLRFHIYLSLKILEFVKSQSPPGQVKNTRWN